MTEIDLIRLSAVPPLVHEKTGVIRSRATIYNWATKGVKNRGQKVFLQTTVKAGQMYTTLPYLDAFLAEINQR